MLARHANVNLSANVYTHSNDNELVASVEKLVAVPSGKLDQPEEGRASGTFLGRPVLGQQWGQQVVETGGISGDKHELRVLPDSVENHKKSQQNVCFAGFGKG